MKKGMLTLMVAGLMALGCENLIYDTKGEESITLPNWNTVQVWRATYDDCYDDYDTPTKVIVSREDILAESYLDCTVKSLTLLDTQISPITIQLSGEEQSTDSLYQAISEYNSYRGTPFMMVVEPDHGLEDRVLQVNESSSGLSPQTLFEVLEVGDRVSIPTLNLFGMDLKNAEDIFLYTEKMLIDSYSTEDIRRL